MTSTDTISSDASSTPSADRSESVGAPVVPTEASSESVAEAATPHVEAQAEAASDADSEGDETEGGEGESEGGEAVADGAPGAVPGDKPKKKRRRKKKRSGGGEGREARAEGAPPRPQHHRASDRAPSRRFDRAAGERRAGLPRAHRLQLRPSAFGRARRGTGAFRHRWLSVFDGKNAVQP